ncbi:MAG: hypothetical protein LQ343_004351 [Gyalolechia ehrenbergii]|nr:MAG: hypothetical protein LQ343_004351 [Gyalolechia ehrenbergii]
MRTFYAALLVLSTLLFTAYGFTKDERIEKDHEIFRLKDEIALTEGDAVTFYDFIGVKSSASQDEITKAYRKKSKLMHPDKAKQSFIASRAKPPPKKPSQKGKKPGIHVSKAPSEKEIHDAVQEATKRHARLSVVAEILKGEGRERYDYFLANGFPRWRGTGYYYARFRPGLGSVLAGLFVVGGGFAHYGALYLSWRRQTEFVERYVRQARRAAWGNESGIAGIPGINGVAAAEQPPPTQIDGAATLNRRQKRQQERESRKEKDSAKSKGVRRSGTNTPMEADSAVEPQGARKRVQAENGKTLIVDSAGNVFLEGEDENGEKQEYLLDPDEISKPTIRQTLVFRLPIWLFSKPRNFISGKSQDSEEENSSNGSDGGALDDHLAGATKTGSDSSSRKRVRRSGKAS